MADSSADSTQRKQVEQVLRETSEHLRAILETAVDGIIVIDERGIIQSVNPATMRLFGYTREELEGSNVSKLMPEPYRNHHDRYIDSYLHTGVRKIIGIGREVVGQRKDGSLFPLDLTVSEMRLAQGRFFTGMVRDISQRKATEQAQALLVEASTLLAQSLDVPTTLRNLALLAVTHLADYCVIDLLGEDERFHRLEALARDPARQELIRRLMQYPTATGSLMAHGLEEERPRLIEFTPDVLAAVAQNAEHRALLETLDIRSSISLPLVARGRKLGLLSLGSNRPGLMSDLATLRVAQAVADRAAIAIDNSRLHTELREAVRVREDVVAVVSHDLRNPLNAITLSAAVLARQGGLDERTARTVARIDAAALRAQRLIRDLLDFTQARVGGLNLSPRTSDVHAIARLVADEFRSTHPERRIDLLATGDGHGEWDPDRLGQVMANLVGNALQHSPADTLVRLETRGHGAEVLIIIHNLGEPIAPELLPVLFEPFRRGREAHDKGESGSLGLGLFITRQIVEAHRGHLEVRSAVGEGTTFTVRIPRLPAAQPAAVRW
jgi:PAS domain S-box-containing protein